MKNTCPFYIAFHVLNKHLTKICKIEPPDLLFLVVFISFYISRYHFSQFSRTSFNIICKKDFHHKFSFLTDSLNHPSYPLKNQNPLSVMKVFCWCSLIFAFYNIYIFQNIHFLCSMLTAKEVCLFAVILHSSLLMFPHRLLVSGLVIYQNPNVTSTAAVDPWHLKVEVAN